MPRAYNLCLSPSHDDSPNFDKKVELEINLSNVPARMLFAAVPAAGPTKSSSPEAMKEGN